MCRFEFYEGIVRSSFGKYITTGLMADASDATEAFIEEVFRAMHESRDGIFASPFTVLFV